MIQTHTLAELMEPKAIKSLNAVFFVAKTGNDRNRMKCGPPDPPALSDEQELFRYPAQGKSWILKYCAAWVGLLVKESVGAVAVRMLPSGANGTVKLVVDQTR